jgi:ClpA/ClpB-like protein/SnoaL-like protein
VFERFTDRSRRVLVLAQEEARLLGHPFIGSEHILLGLIGADGAASRVLTSCGVSLDTAREAVHRLVGSGRAGTVPQPFTPGAKKVLERALREALAVGSSTIGDEHLLLGLVSPADGVIVSVLAEYGLTGDSVRPRAENALAGQPGVGPGLVERYFRHLSGRDWAALGDVLAEDVVRIGPMGDEVLGRARYLELLASSVPERYDNDVHRIAYDPGGASCFARVTEHLFYPGGELHLEETYAFEIRPPDEISRVEVFWQTPGPAA